MSSESATTASPNLLPRRRRGVLSRAELLLALELGQDPNVCAPAPDAEYVEPPRGPPINLDLVPQPVNPDNSRDESGGFQASRSRLPLQWLWLLTEQTALAEVVPSQSPEQPLPELRKESTDVIRRAYAAAEAPATRRGWRKLRAQLQVALRGSSSRPAPDWAAACTRLARGRPLWPLPVKQARKWPGSLVVIEDARDDLALYEHEWTALRIRLQLQIGKAGVRKHVLRHARSPLPAMPHGQPVVLLSDALTQGGDGVLAAWARRLQQHGYPLLAWQPAAWLQGYAGTLALGAPVRPNDPRLQQLIALVYLLRYVEHPLLRCMAVRLLPGWGALGLIHALQRHPAIARGYGGVAVAAAALADPEFVAQMEACLRRFRPDDVRAVLADWWTLHAVLSEVDRLSPALRFPALLPQLCVETAGLNAHARKLLLGDLPQAMRQPSTARHAALSALRAAKFLAPSCAPPEQIALSGLYHQAKQQLGDEPASASALPSGLHPHRQDAAVGDWLLRQVGDTVLLEPKRSQGISLAALTTLPLAQGALVRLDQPSRHRDLRVGSLTASLADAGRIVVPAAPLPQSLKLRTPSHQLSLTAIPRPRWAIGWGRDQRGAFVLAPSPLGKAHRFDIAEGAGLNAEQPLLLREQGERIEVLGSGPGATFALGVDGYGLFATVQIKGVTQRLRWLAPGEFWMGAEGESNWEAERPRHRVKLTEGLWLADTACSQAFWLAVVGGENPSFFHDDPMLPVEQVSWNDITQGFLPRLQAALGDAVQAVLPSEAQWEYACRAGTDSPFSFGESITPEQVNYDGNLPYGKGAKGLHRQRTVPVASLPANPWGFYEMHGNVWEWCRDGRRSYGPEPVSDPEGPPGSYRVLRGGSWFDDASNARSAFRIANAPGSRYVFIGFRLGLRSLSPVRGRPEKSWWRRWFE